MASMALALAASPVSAAPLPADYAADALSLDALIVQQYAYPEKLPGGALPQSPALTNERTAVHDKSSLLSYAEDRMATLADHHAITGSSFNDSWAVVPTYADLWIVRTGNRYLVDAVRAGSVSERAGVKSGDELRSVNGVATALAVTRFWSRLGLAVTPQRADYAARVLAAGRRDRGRKLEFVSPSGAERTLDLPSLYGPSPDRPLLAAERQGKRSIIRIHNSLGDQSLIAAFDTAMARLPANRAVVIDLRDTPSGGNTSVARAIMGWFVDRPRGYQIHKAPVEERETGIARQWIEQVLPRAGKHRAALPQIWVGRWTGSMGEGLAIGFAALGASVRGGPMAGLNGSVEDLTLEHSGLAIKIPTERLMTVQGQPRETYRPGAM